MDLYTSVIVLLLYIWVTFSCFGKDAFILKGSKNYFCKMFGVPALLNPRLWLCLSVAPLCYLQRKETNALHEDFKSQEQKWREKESDQVLSWVFWAKHLQYIILIFSPLLSYLFCEALFNPVLKSFLQLNFVGTIITIILDFNLLLQIRDTKWQSQGQRAPSAV